MIQLKVNSVTHSFDGDPGMPLLSYLRDHLQLTGTKYGAVWRSVGPALCTWTVPPCAVVSCR
jgi:isoquinoline 1-oxidoreductase/isoquinoline 1-oxidoreductase alpha subunit